MIITGFFLLQIYSYILENLHILIEIVEEKSGEEVGFLTEN